MNLCELPEGVLDRIARACGAAALFNLACTDRFWASFLNDSHDLWQDFWENKVCDTAKRRVTDEALAGAISAKQRLRLVGFTGCVFCGAKRIRKVYWEFAVRCCTDCLHARTISDYRVTHDYAVPADALAGLPFVTTEMWSRGHGTYTVKFHWRDHIVPLLRRYHGVDSFEEYARRKQEAEQRAREDKRAIEERKVELRRVREAKYREWCADAGLDPDIAMKRSYTLRAKSAIAAAPRWPSFVNNVLPVVRQELEAWQNKQAGR